MQLLVCVLNKTQYLNEILKELSKNKIYGATIVTSKGMAHYLNENEDITFMDSIFKMLNPENNESKTFFMVTDDETVQKTCNIIDRITGGIDKPDTGILFTVPVGFVMGMKSY